MKHLFTCLLLLGSAAAAAQSFTGFNVFGLSLHPQGDENALLMPRRLDPRAVWVLNAGGVLMHEQAIIPGFLSVKAAQALYADCAGLTGGFSHIGLRASMIATSRHRLSGGIGPTLIYRRNWQQLEGYRNSGYFRGAPGDALQYRFLWYGGDLEYSYRLQEHSWLSVTFIPGYPKLMSLSAGWRYRWDGE